MLPHLLIDYTDAIIIKYNWQILSENFFTLFCICVTDANDDTYSAKVFLSEVSH